MRRLSSEGVSIVYISHRMPEIQAVAHRVTVLKDGRAVMTAPLAEAPTNRLAAIPLAALTTLVIAVPVMAAIFRLRTAYLAVGTWVAADVLMLVAGKLPGFGGGSGTSLPIPVVKQFGARLGDRIDVFYAMSLGLALIAFVATWALLRSRVGLGLTAMRDNEEAAGSAGVDLIRTRIVCFLWTRPSSDLRAR